MPIICSRERLTQLLAVSTKLLSSNRSHLLKRATKMLYQESVRASTKVVPGYSAPLFWFRNASNFHLSNDMHDSSGMEICGLQGIQRRHEAANIPACIVPLHPSTMAASLLCRRRLC